LKQKSLNNIKDGQIGKRKETRGREEEGQERIWG
jgi:hypothetical protein